jgi:sugar lactone lactonase YvrE
MRKKMKTDNRRLCATLGVMFILAFPGNSILHADTIYVYSDNPPTIDKFNSSGQKSAFVSGVASYFLACDRYGNLYATFNSNSIVRYNSNGKRYLFATLTSSPKGIAFDNSDNLYAATDNGYVDTIEKFDSSGNETTFASGIDGAPRSLAFNGSSCFYTVDGSNILKIDMSGNVSTFASGLSSNYLHGLACDSIGNLYAAFESKVPGNNSTIIRFDSSGNYTTFASGLYMPFGLAFDNNNNLYVTDMDSSGEIGSRGIILKFDPSGNGSVFATGLDDSPTAIAIYVPEPASMMILALGGLILRRKKH